MPFCSSCGNELRGDSKFCAECGQPVPEPVGGTAGAAPAPPPPPPAQTAAGFNPPPPPPPFPGARRRSLKWVWIGGAAAAVVIAVVCVLVFVVFKGGDDGQTAVVSTTISANTGVTQPIGSTGTNQTAPVSTTAATVSTTAATVAAGGDDAKAVEKVVRQLFKAMENQDVELLFSQMDPTLLGMLPEGDARDAAIAAVKAELATLGKMKFSGIEMKVDITSPTTATVTLTAGKATITDSNGQTTTEDIKDSSTPGTMDLTKIDGKWYVASSFFQ